MATGIEHDADFRRAGREFHLRSSMPSFVQSAVFVVLVAVSIGLGLYVGRTSETWGIAVGVAGTIVAALAGGFD